jgi:hypothetical protein
LLDIVVPDRYATGQGEAARRLASVFADPERRRVWAPVVERPLIGAGRFGEVVGLH